MGGVIPLSKVVLERVPTKGDLLSAVQSLFAPFGGLESLLGGRKRVLIKINAVDFRPPETFISPAILEAVIIAFRQAGVKRSGLWKTALRVILRALFLPSRDLVMSAGVAECGRFISMKVPPRTYPSGIKRDRAHP